MGAKQSDIENKKLSQIKKRESITYIGETTFAEETMKRAGITK